MIRRKTKERPFGATDERENVILSGTKWSRRISTYVLLTMTLAILSACTDYAAKMEDDFEEWKACREFSEPTEGSMTDARDGQTYRTVVVGSQIWMAQNLNYEAENSLCYNDDPANCATYGRLYTWAAAMTACPCGWHLPSTEAFETLFSAVGGSGTAGKMLKSTSGWFNDGNGTDAYAFSALPAGFRNNYGDYYYEGLNAYFWSSTELNSDLAYYMGLYYKDGSADLYYNYKNHGFPVRCLKD